jgi:hypothetical protein
MQIILNVALSCSIIFPINPSLAEDVATDGAPPPDELQAISQDVANTLNPEATTPDELSQVGVIRLDRADERTVLVYKSGTFSDKIDLVADESGCFSGDGLAAQVTFCDSQRASFVVRGGPALTCPHHSSIFFGPCEVRGEEE